MKKYEEFETVEKTKILKCVKCDKCNSEITGAYYEVFTGHHDWGYDSRDASEWFDICQLECLKEHMSEYFEDSAGTPFYEIDRMKRVSG